MPFVLTGYHSRATNCCLQQFTSINTLIVLPVLPSITDRKTKGPFLRDPVLFVVDKQLNRGYMRPFSIERLNFGMKIL